MTPRPCHPKKILSMSPNLIETLTSTIQQIEDAARAAEIAPKAKEIGKVTFVSQGIARISGLPGVQVNELIQFPENLLGLAFNLDEDEVGVILLDEAQNINAGAEVHRTHRVLDVPVGASMLGRIVDAVGRPLDNGPPIHTNERREVEREAPAIMDRSPVSEPLQTGIKVIDALIPVGKGQRELIVGDRQTGKTAIAQDTILNQKDKDVICVYCAIGQRSSAIATLVEDLRTSEAMKYSLVVASTEEDPPGLQYITPYAATSIAEFFMDQGRDVLIIYDDLTRHARAYRELSLLLRRPPGREAFPGDIFYIHSRLLERSTHLRPEFGGGSLTALPICETEAQNISAYIPTNLISITDGQIYLSPELFQKSVLPAVDVGKSVSRVGGKTQLPAYRAVAGELRLAYTQFEELEGFARFGTRLDESTRQSLERGRRVREVLKQEQYQPLQVLEQIAAFVSVTRGLFDDIPVDKVDKLSLLVGKTVQSELQGIREKIMDGKKLDSEDVDAIASVAERVIGDQQINNHNHNE